MDAEKMNAFYDLPDNTVHEWLEAHQDQLSLELVEAGKTKAQDISDRGNLDGALHILDRAAMVAHILEEPLAEALVWRGRANVLSAHERYTESLINSDEAVALYEKKGTPYDVAIAKTLEVKVRGALEHFDEAIDLALWIRPHFIRERFTFGEARLIDALAQVYTWAWRLSEALPEYEQAQKLYLQLEMPVDAARVLHNMGYLANRMDKLDLALHCYTQAYPELMAAGDVIMMIKTQQNLARLCQRQGQYEAALAHLAQARTILVDLPDSPDRGYVNLYEAQVRWRLNQAAQAEVLLREALDLFNKLGRGLEAVEMLVALGHLLAADGKPDKLAEALSYLEQAEANLQELDVPLFVAWVQLEQAEIHFRLRHTQEAVRLAEAARSVFADAKLQLRHAQANLLLADCCWRSESERARQLYQAALVVVGEAVPLMAARCWHGLGRLASAEGRYKEAEQSYSQAVTLLDAVRRALSEHRQQAGFLEDKQALMEELMTVLHQQPNSESRLLTWVERFKAGALAELLLALSPQTVTDDDFQALLTEREALRAKLDHWESQFKGETGLGETFARQRSAGLRRHEQYHTKKLTDLRHQLQAVEEQLARRHGAAYEWHQGATIDAQAVHELLDEETLLLSYYTAQGGQLYALTATHALGDLQIHPLGTTLTELTTRWNQSARLMMRPSKRVKSLQKRLADLWQRLIQPMQKRLRTKKRLLILPYRDLFQIPFAGLYNPRTKRYLIQDWTVQIAPSATVLSKCQPTGRGNALRLPRALPQQGKREALPQQGKGEALPQQGKREALPLLIGNPGDPYLPGVEPEIENLKRLLPKAEVLFNDAATLTNVMERLPNRPLIHIAGHIVYDGQSPLDSGIPLAEERWLRASDLYLQHGTLASSTIVLSGCDSAGGSAQGGDILGLTSAFLYAGAAGIVASLWPVDDEATGALMSALYRGLVDGLQTAEALRKAQLQLLHQKATEHPYYWAPFVLNGASRVLTTIGKRVSGNANL